MQQRRGKDLLQAGLDSPFRSPADSPRGGRQPAASHHSEGNRQQEASLRTAVPTHSTVLASRGGLVREHPPGQQQQQHAPAGEPAAGVATWGRQERQHDSSQQQQPAEAAGSHGSAQHRPAGRAGSGQQKLPAEDAAAGMVAAGWQGDEHGDHQQAHHLPAADGAGIYPAALRSAGQLQPVNAAVAGQMQEGHVASQSQPSGAQSAWGQQQRLQPAKLQGPAGGQPLHWAVAGSADGSSAGQPPHGAEAAREAGRGEEPLHCAKAGLAEGSSAGQPLHWPGAVVDSTGLPLHQAGPAEGAGVAERLQHWPEAGSEAGNAADPPSPQSDVSPSSLPGRAHRAWPAPPSGSLSVDQDSGDMLQPQGAGMSQGGLNARPCTL